MRYILQMSSLAPFITVLAERTEVDVDMSVRRSVEEGTEGSVRTQPRA